jgi:hypothetical protein
MRRFVILLVLTAVAAVAVGTARGALQGSHLAPANTAVGAERRVLSSPRVFWRWGGAARRLVDPKTRLMRTGTKATCHSRKTTTSLPTFVCSVHRGTDAVRLLYVARRTSAFTLRRL